MWPGTGLLTLEPRLPGSLCLQPLNSTAPTWPISLLPCGGGGQLQALRLSCPVALGIVHHIFGLHLRFVFSSWSPSSPRLWLPFKGQWDQAPVRSNSRRMLLLGRVHLRVGLGSREHEL